jgi:hypothetical protein
VTRAALALLVVVLAAGGAHAEPRDVPVDQPAVLDVDAAWRLDAPSDAADAPAMVLRHADGGVLAVTVAMAPNPDAWRKRKRKAYFADVVAGFEDQPGVKVDKHKDLRVKGVPTLELWLTRTLEDGGSEVVFVRVLLFRTRTIMAAAAGPKAAKKRLEAAARGLAPKHEADPDR